MKRVRSTTAKAALAAAAAFAAVLATHSPAYAVTTLFSEYTNTETYNTTITATRSDNGNIIGRGFWRSDPADGETGDTLKACDYAADGKRIEMQADYLDGSEWGADGKADRVTEPLSDTQGDCDYQPGDLPEDMFIHVRLCAYDAPYVNCGDWWLTRT